MDNRFIQVRQRDILTKPEEWRNAKPSKFIKLSNRAKNVYCVLSVIAFSSAGNVKGEVLRNEHKLGDGWFWVSHHILQKLTGQSQKTVQRGIAELVESKLLDYHASKAQGQKCYFRIKNIAYNTKTKNIAYNTGRGEKAQPKPKGGREYQPPEDYDPTKDAKSSKYKVTEDDKLLVWKYEHGYKETLTDEEDTKVIDLGYFHGIHRLPEDYIDAETRKQLDEQLQEARRKKEGA